MKSTSIDVFSPEYRQILVAILHAHEDGVLLTRRSYLDYLEAKKVKRATLLAEETLYNKLYLERAQRDDAPMLLKSIIKKQTKEGVIDALRKYKDDDNLDTLTDALTPHPQAIPTRPRGIKFPISFRDRCPEDGSNRLSDLQALWRRPRSKAPKNLALILAPHGERSVPELMMRGTSP